MSSKVPELYGKGGYDPITDVVWLDLSDRGEVIEIENLKIGLPRVPKDKKKILFSNIRKKSDQYWRRTPVPEELDEIDTFEQWNDMSDDFKKKHLPYIEEEFRRRENGVWFMNNGVPTYLTGSHYMFIQHSVPEGIIPNYREPNRKFFTFWEACKVDERCFGICYLKNRRSGFSVMSASISVNEGTSVESKKLGTLSKTNEDAQDLFVDKIGTILNNYPFFFMPNRQGKDDAKKRFEFKSTFHRGNKNTKYIPKKHSLNTIIDYRATGSNSYDGNPLYLLIQDEAGKWQKPNSIRENWRVTKTCLTKGALITGKCLMGSTANAGDKGGDEFEKIYYDSKLGLEDSRDGNGRTKSGLYSMFIGCLENSETFFNKYGECVQETPEEPYINEYGDLQAIGTRQHYQNERDALRKDPADYYEQLRQFPMEDKEAFLRPALGAIFPEHRLVDQLDHIKNLKATKKFDLKYKRGNFVYDEDFNSTELKVKFIPDDKGKFLISWFPAEEDRNRSVYKRDGNYYPLNNNVGVFGCDPVDQGKASSKKVSNAACYGFLKIDPFNINFSNKFVVEYVARPDNPNVFFDDMLKVCIYYGWEILVEKNKYGLINYFCDRGYAGYLMKRPKETFNEHYKKNKGDEYGIAMSSQDVKSRVVENLVIYSAEHIGYNDNTGAISENNFEKLLESMRRFDGTNWRESDEMIAGALAVTGISKIVKDNESNIRTKVKTRRFKYDRNGARIK